jgi:hypothetical protein
MEIITKITPMYGESFEIEEEILLEKAVNLAREKYYIGRLQIEYIMINGPDKLVCADFGIDENDRISYALLPNKI